VTVTLTITSQKRKSHWPCLPKMKKQNNVKYEHDDDVSAKLHDNPSSDERQQRAATATVTTNKKKRKANNNSNDKESASAPVKADGCAVSSKRAKTKKRGGNDSSPPSPSKVETKAFSATSIIDGSGTTLLPRPTYRGVTYRPLDFKYEAKVRVHDLGLFDLACDAALAYDAAHRITAGGDDGDDDGNNALIANDAEEIKYALNWLDHDDDQVEATSRSMVNFAKPSQYREARQVELGNYLAGKIHRPDFDLKKLLNKEALKIRIKKEILNLARAYVATRQKAAGDDTVAAEAASSTATQRGSVDDDNHRENGRNVANKVVVSSLLKKKAWVPQEDPEETKTCTKNEAVDAVRNDTIMDDKDATGVEALLSLQKNQNHQHQKTNEEEEEDAAHEAQILALQAKKREGETKKVALAKKLELMMSGDGVTPPSLPGSTRRARPDSPSAGALSAGGQKKGGSLVNNLEEDKSSSAIGPNSKINEENPSANQHQLHLRHMQLLQQQRAALERLGGVRTGGIPPSHSVSNIDGSRTGVADALRSHVVPPNGLLHSAGPAFPSRDVSANQAGATLEQLLLFASRHPGKIDENAMLQLQERQAEQQQALLASRQSDRIDENTILQLLLQERQAREKQQALALQVRAGLQQRCPLLPPATSVGLRQQHSMPAPVPSSTQGVSAVAAGNEARGQIREEALEQLPRPEEAASSLQPYPKATPTGECMPPSKVPQAAAAATGDDVVEALLASMVHRGPVPQGLAEHLRVALEQQEKQQNRGGQSGIPLNRGGEAKEGGGRAMIGSNDNDCDGDDPETVMRRQLANEAKKAALAQKLNVLMSGGSASGGSQENNAAKQELLTAAASSARDKSVLEGLHLDIPPQGSMGINPVMQTKSMQLESRSEGDMGSVLPKGERPSDGLYHQPTTKSSIDESRNAGKEKGRVLHPESRSSSAGQAVQSPQLTALGVLQAAQDLPGDQCGLKKQMQEGNKQALEQKVQDYIQGKGGIFPQQHQQPSPNLSAGVTAPSSSELSHNLALQSLLSQNGSSSCSTGQSADLIARHHQAQQQPSDLVRQAAIQSLLSSQHQPQQHQQQQQQQLQSHLSMTGGLGSGANNDHISATAADALTHDLVNRRLAIESMLMGEENRLRRLRETLQSQFVTSSHYPQQQLNHGMMVGSGFGAQQQPQSLLDVNMHQELMRERERIAMLSNEDFRRTVLAAEINNAASPASNLAAAVAAEQQHRMQQQQEVALRQVLALGEPSASSGGGLSSFSQSSMANAGGTAPLHAESGTTSRALGPASADILRLLETARNHGLDPQLMTPGQLALLVASVSSPADAAAQLPGM